jgi:hypothetical protein
VRAAAPGRTMVPALSTSSPSAARTCTDGGSSTHQRRVCLQRQYYSEHVDAYGPNREKECRILCAPSDLRSQREESVGGSSAGNAEMRVRRAQTPNRNGSQIQESFQCTTPSRDASGDMRMKKRFAMRSFIPTKNRTLPIDVCPPRWAHDDSVRRPIDPSM